MNKPGTGFSITVFSLILAALGIAAPIAWDLWNSRSEITLTKKHSVTLIKKESALDKLSILYSGKPIDTLSKVVFILENTGRTPIVKDDLISPPSLTFEHGDVLEVSIEAKDPPDMDATLRNEQGTLSIFFPLLNPKDRIEFSVLTSGTDLEFSATSRIKNVRALSLVDEESQLRIRKNPGFGLYIVAIFSVFFTIVFIALLLDIPKRQRALQAFRAMETPIHKGETIEVVRSYLERDLSFIDAKNKKHLLSILAGISGRLTTEQATHVAALTQGYVESVNPLGGAIVILVIIGAGGWYVFTSLFG